MFRRITIHVWESRKNSHKATKQHPTLDNLNGISFRGHKFRRLSVMACNASPEWNTFIWLWSWVRGEQFSWYKPSWMAVCVFSPFLTILNSIEIELGECLQQGVFFLTDQSLQKVDLRLEIKETTRRGPRGSFWANMPPWTWNWRYGLFFHLFSLHLYDQYNLPQMQSKALITFWTLTSLENQTSGWPPFNSNRGHIYFLIEDTNNDYQNLNWS